MGTARKKTKRRSDSHNLFNLRAEYKSKIFVINSDKKKEKKTAYFKEYWSSDFFFFKQRKQN